MRRAKLVSDQNEVKQVLQLLNKPEQGPPVSAMINQILGNRSQARTKVLQKNLLDPSNGRMPSMQTLRQILLKSELVKKNSKNFSSKLEQPLMPKDRNSREIDTEINFLNTLFHAPDMQQLFKNQPHLRKYINKKRFSSNSPLHKLEPVIKLNSKDGNERGKKKKDSFLPTVTTKQSTSAAQEVQTGFKKLACSVKDSQNRLQRIKNGKSLFQEEESLKLDQSGNSKSQIPLLIKENLHQSYSKLIRAQSSLRTLRQLSAPHRIFGNLEQSPNSLQLIQENINQLPSQKLKQLRNNQISGKNQFDLPLNPSLVTPNEQSKEKVQSIDQFCRKKNLAFSSQQQIFFKIKQNQNTHRKWSSLVKSLVPPDFTTPDIDVIIQEGQLPKQQIMSPQYKRFANAGKSIKQQYSSVGSNKNNMPKIQEGSFMPSPVPMISPRRYQMSPTILPPRQNAASPHTLGKYYRHKTSVKNDISHMKAHSRLSIPAVSINSLTPRHGYNERQSFNDSSFLNSKHFLSPQPQIQDMKLRNDNMRATISHSDSSRANFLGGISVRVYSKLKNKVFQNNPVQKKEPSSKIRRKSVKKHGAINVLNNIIKQSEAITNSKKENDQKLQKMLKRVELDRPIIMRDKIDIIWSGKKSDKIFESQQLRTKLIMKRSQRTSKIQEQKTAYLKMLKWIQHRYNQDGELPDEDERRVLEALKVIIDAGWVIEDKDLSEVLKLVNLNVIKSNKRGKVQKFIDQLKELFKFK